MDKTAAFPRGKGSSASLSHHAEEVSTKKSSASSNQRELFGSENKRGKRIEVVQKDKRNKSGSKPAKLLPSIGLGIVGTGENVDKVPYVSEKDFKAGAQFLGFVLSITEVSALISCPNGFIATLAKEEVSDVVYHSLRSMNEDEDLASFDGLITPYQPLRCCVLPHDPSSGDTRPTVSCRGSLVNRGLALKHLLPGFALSCALQSIEDHGYILTAGLEGVHFFLPKHAVMEQELVIGQPLECIVDDMNFESRTVTLRLRADDILEEVVANRSIPFVGLTPGMLFNVVLEKKLPSGLLVSYLSLFQGMIDRQSLSKLYTDEEWSEVIIDQKLLKARIVFVDHANKTVRLSQRPHVMLLHAPVNLPPIGSIVEDCQVMLASKRGVYLRKEDATFSSDALNEDDDNEAANEEETEGKDKKINRKERRRMEAAELVKLETQIQYFSIAEKALAARVPSTITNDDSDDKAEEEDDDEVDDEEVEEGDNNEDDNNEPSTSKVTQQSSVKPSSKSSKPPSSKKTATEEEATTKGQRINYKHIVSSYPIHDIIPNIRIRGYKLVENICLASNLTEYLTSTITHISDLKVGQLHTVTISQIRDFGLKVTIAGKITAICSTYHTSDAASYDSKLLNKFKVGQKLKMRVLEVDIFPGEKTRVSMTAKKSLLDTSKTFVLDIDDASVGTQTLGTITKVTNEGICVNFFNKIWGFLSSMILSQQGIIDPVSHYRRGQLLQVVVIHKNVYQRRNATRPAWQLFLALDMNLSPQLIDSYAALVRPKSANTITSSEGKAGEKGEKNKGNPKQSKIVSGTIFRYDSDTQSYFVRLSDGRTGRLPAVYIYDFTSTLTALSDQEEEESKKGGLDIGHVVSKALVIQEEKDGTVILTTKHLLLLSSTEEEKAEEVGIIPSSITEDNLQPGQVLIGIIHKVEAYGIIIRFRNYLSGLVTRPNISDRFVNTAEGLFTVNDSIRCVIQRADYNSKKLFLTLKNSLIPSSNSINYLFSYFSEQFTILQNKRKNVNLAWEKYRLGSIITATVSSVEEYGIVFLADDNHTLLLYRTTTETQQIEVQIGQELKVLLTNIDFEHMIFLVNILTDNTILKVYEHSLKSDFSLPQTPLAMTVTNVDLKAGIVCVQGLVPVQVKKKSKMVFVSGFVSLVDYHMPKATTSSNVSVGDTVTCAAISQGQQEEEEVSFPHQQVNYFRLVNDNNNNNKTKTAPTGQVAVKENTHIDDNDDHAAAAEVAAVGGGGGSTVTHRTGQVSTWTISAISHTEVTLHSSLNPTVIGKIPLFMTLDSYSADDQLALQLSTSNSTNYNNHPFDDLKVGDEVTCQTCRVTSSIIYVRLLPQTSEENATLRKSARIPSYFLHFPTLSSGKYTVLKGVIIKLKDNEFKVMVSPGLIVGISYLEITKNQDLRQQFLSKKEKNIVGMSITFLAVSLSATELFCSRAIIEDFLQSTDNKEEEVDISELQVQIENEKSEFFQSIPPVITSNGKSTLTAGDIVFGTVPTFSVRNGSFTIELDHSHSNNTTAKIDFTEIDDVNQWQDYSDCEALVQEKNWLEMKSRGLLYPGLRVRCVVLTINDNNTSSSKKQGSVSANPSTTIITVSLRPSRLYDTQLKSRMKSDTLPTSGALIQGYVTSLTDKGCFIRLSSTHIGRAMIRDLSDEFLMKPSEHFPIGKLITARVKQVDHLTGHIQLDCKPSVINHNTLLKQAISQLQSAPTKVTTGIIDSIHSNLGVFVKLEHYSPIIGLARTVTALQNPNHTLQDEYQVGDKVQVRVLKVSTKSLRVMLGLREKYFRSDYVLEEMYRINDDENDNEVEVEVEAVSQGKGESNSRKKKKEQVKQFKAGITPSFEDSSNTIAAAVNIIEDEQDEDVEPKAKKAKKESKKEKKASKKRKADDDEEQVIDTSTATVQEAEPKKKQKKALPAIVAVADDDLDLDLVWDTTTTTTAAKNKNKRGIEDTLQDDDSDNNDTDNNDKDDATNKKSSKKSRKHDDHKHAERTLRERELALAEGRLLPESVDDFERLIIAQPNSSFLWVKYLAFHVQAADIDAARVIANRALRTIHFREEDEKFNVWIALLNMEHRYGTKESFDTALRQAVSESKGKRIYLAMAASLEQAGDISNAEQLFERALKAPQFRKSKKVWMAYHSLLLRAASASTVGATNSDSKANEAKKELARALQSLSQHKHLEVIKHFALAEFDHGSIDRGRVLFEEMLSNYPKRTDLWHIYVDKEAKLNNVQEARQLFERMITLKTSAKNMKAIFKKYLFFESRFGDEQTQEMVKEKARDYVNSLA